MIVGVGADIVCVKRINTAIESPRFVREVYTDEERRMIGERNKDLSFAGNFAAKEAVAKALGTGFRGFLPIDIEVLRDEIGKPYVNLFKGAIAACVNAGASKIHISISDCDEYATAFAVAEDVGENSDLYF